MAPAYHQQTLAVDSKIFRGDAEHLVDELIAACQKKPVASTAYTGYGRELVPWTDDSVVPAACSESLDRQSRRTTGQERVRVPANPHKHARAAGRVADSPEQKKTQSKRSKTSVALAFYQAAPGVSGSSRRSSSSDSGFACPAIATSPKPEQLPMPTNGFMSRALLRARSPSPPKDMPSSFPHALLVNPVCAVA